MRAIFNLNSTLTFFCCKIIIITKWIKTVRYVVFDFAIGICSVCVYLGIYIRKWFTLEFAIFCFKHYFATIFGKFFTVSPDKGLATLTKCQKLPQLFWKIPLMLHKDSTMNSFNLSKNFVELQLVFNSIVYGYLPHSKCTCCVQIIA